MSSCLMRLAAVLLMLCCTQIAAKSVLTVLGQHSRVSIFPAWAFENTDCFASACPEESVINLFVTAPAGESDYCKWAKTQVDRPMTKTWTAVGSPEVSLNIEAFVQNYFNSSTCQNDIAARADSLLLLNDMPASSIVRINVIENSATKLNVSADNVSTFFCWNYPTSCDAASERFVVNVFVDSFCSSGCVAASADTPTCFGNEGCASTGTCISHNKCSCDHGYDGPRCATHAGCETNGCTNHGDCDTLTGQCSCFDGYSGDRCEKPANNNNNNNSTNNGGNNNNNNNRAVPAAHGDTIGVSDAWLAPFTVFPRFKVSHWGEVSVSQLPWRSNLNQNARRAIEQPRASPDGPEFYGFVSANTDYENGTIQYEISITFPRNTLKIGNQPTNALIADLRNAAVGYTNDAVVTALAGKWCIIPSWISAEWSAFRLNGTVKFDDVYGEALANGDVYVQLRQQDGSALARGQLSRVDEVYGASLVGPMQHQGAAAVFVDTKHSTLHYWIIYTTPLTYIERGASIHAISTTSDETIALPLGTQSLTRIGLYDQANPKAGIVCVLNKFGAYNFGTTTLAAIRAGELVVTAVGLSETLSGTILP